MISCRMKEPTQRAVLYTVISILGFVFVFRYFWMVLSSFNTVKDVIAIPIRFFPPEWNWKSYVDVFTAFPDFIVPRFILNSHLVTTAAVLLCLFFSATAGYGFAKYELKGNNLLLAVVLATIMISFETIVVPLFILVRKIQLQTAYNGLIITESLTAFGAFMMQQFFYSLPDDYIEIARIDGAMECAIFARISISMGKTALLALVIIHAQWVWNLLLWLMILISTPPKRVLPQGMALFKGGYNTPYPEQSAVSVIASLPLFIRYMFLSTYFVQGFTMTGLEA